MLNKFIYLLVGCLILSLTPTQAQSITARIDLGKREPQPDFYEYSPVDQGLITLGPSSKSSSRYLSITKYNSRLKKEWSKKVIEQNGRKTIDFTSVVGANILVFVSEEFPKEKVIKTYYYQYDLAGNEIASEAILSVYPNDRQQKVNLQYVMSRNKRRLLCYKNLKNKRDSEELLYYIFDDEGDVMVNGEINLKYPDNRFQVTDVRVSNQGNVYLLGKFSRVNNIREAGDQKYIIYRQDTREQLGEEIPVELGNRYITNLAFRLDRNENIYVAGFYSNRSTDQIAGTILQRIERNGELSLNVSQKFDAGFLSNYLSTGQINRGRELRNFYLKDIVLRSDGGVLLMAEKFFITTESYRDIYGAWIDRQIYHYGDIILTSIASNGDIEWHSIVDKQQVSDSPASLSYFSAIGQDGAYLFYEYKPRRSKLNIYYNNIGIGGEVSDRIPLLKSYGVGNEFYPKFCEQTSNNEAIMIYYQNRGRLLSVIKIKFAPS